MEARTPGTAAPLPETLGRVRRGEFLTATGQQQGDALVATAVSLSDQAPQFGGQAQAGQ